MSKLLRVFAFLGALALVWAVVAVLGLRSGSRVALRQYLAEQQAKGEKLTYEELTRGRLTNFSDSHAVITNAQPRLKTAGDVPSLLELQTATRPGEAKVTWRQPNPTWGKSNGPGDHRTWEELDRDLQAAQDTLQEIRTALKIPALNAGPCTNMWTGRRINFVSIRTVAFWLLTAAENDLRQGRLEEALQNLEALTALAYMERDEPTLVAHMIRVAVAGLALPATWEALQAPGWTEPQLERLQRAWERVDLLDAAERGFVGQRASGYELFSMARRTSGSRMSALLTGQVNFSWRKTPLEEMFIGCLITPFYKLTSIDSDELFYLRTMQQGISGLRLLKAHRPWAEAQQRLNQSLSNINTISSSPQRFRHLVSMMVLPNYAKAAERAVQTETSRQVALAAIALKRYQLRHGQLPPTLEALAPELLPTVPWDYLGAQPLRYRPKADGTYLLYSVGMDGNDDGGDPTPRPGDPAALWNGRDAVWPLAASEPAALR
jgi:hypothetical protein